MEKELRRFCVCGGGSPPKGRFSKDGNSNLYEIVKANIDGRKDVSPEF